MTITKWNEKVSAMFDDASMYQADSLHYGNDADWRCSGMKRTMKVLDLFLDDGRQIICIRDYMAKCNEYKVYYRWYDCGWHKRKLAEYADMRSVLAHLLQESYN